MSVRLTSRRRLGIPLLATAALVASLLGTVAGPSAAGAARSTGHRIAPVPAITGHIQSAALKDPPSTADCQALLHINCYSPPQFQQAYNLGPLYRDGFTGRGRTIVIVDSFGSPTIRNDLHVFDQTYGLPDPQLDIIQPAGAVPPFDPTNSDMLGWASETTLDVEWAHAIAPGAKLLLVETPVAETEGLQGFPEIVKAENFVVDRHR